MPYRIAGIDVHKKMLAIAVADVEVDGDFHFERQKVGTTPIDLRRLADWLVEHNVDEVVMESTAQYWRPVWEALEQHWPPAPCAPERAAARGHAPSGPRAIESGCRRTQAGLSRCGAVGETSRRAGTHLELRARRRATTLAHRDAPQVPGHPQSRATPESSGRAARGSAHQGVEPRLRSARHQCPPDAAGAGGRRNGSGGPGDARDRAPACHTRANCAMPLRRVRRCIRYTAGC